MSFDTLKVAELRVIATDFAVDTEGLKNKKTLLQLYQKKALAGMYIKVQYRQSKKIQKKLKFFQSLILCLSQKIQSLSE